MTRELPLVKGTGFSRELCYNVGDWKDNPIGDGTALEMQRGLTALGGSTPPPSASAKVLKSSAKTAENNKGERMSGDKLAQAFDQYPNLANRALVMLLEDETNVQKVSDWIIERSKFDIRFARLGEKVGLPVCEYKEVTV